MVLFGDRVNDWGIVSAIRGSRELLLTSVETWAGGDAERRRRGAAGRHTAGLPPGPPLYRGRAVGQTLISDYDFGLGFWTRIDIEGGREAGIPGTWVA